MVLELVAAEVLLPHLAWHYHHPPTNRRPRLVRAGKLLGIACVWSAVIMVGSGIFVPLQVVINSVNGMDFEGKHTPVGRVHEAGCFCNAI